MILIRGQVFMHAETSSQVYKIWFKWSYKNIKVQKM